MSLRHVNRTRTVGYANDAADGVTDVAVVDAAVDTAEDVVDAAVGTAEDVVVGAVTGAPATGVSELISTGYLYHRYTYR